MLKRQKFCVYLAGPIHGCNDDQIRQWRDDVERKYAPHFTFSDPAKRLLGKSATPYEIVEADLRAIDEADGLLVNMWRESIGSAIGVVHAHRKGKPVVVADPNHLKSRMLDFYVDAVKESPLKAARALLDLLRAEADWFVIKSTERDEEPFERRKLMAAIRAACRSAGRDDLVVPRLVLPVVIDRLKKSDRRTRKRFATDDIATEVLATLADLEGDPTYGPLVTRIASAWEERRQQEKRHDRQRAPRRRITAPVTGHVDIACSKSHGTIWGKTVKKLDDIPSTDARKVFQAIWGVSGITRISLGRFGRKESRSACRAFVGGSKTPCVIEGKLFDRSDKGTMQSFQVRIQSDSDKQTILDGIIATLKTSRLWAG